MEHYTVVSNNWLENLVDGVNEMIEIGYKPIGGISKDGEKFYQAMFLDSKSDCSQEKSDEEILRDIELL
jgi:hypothetical protein